MKRFQKYLSARLNLDYIHDTNTLNSLGITSRYIPESFEYLDEMEFVMEYASEKNVVMGVTTENQEVKRIMFGWAPPDDEDDAFNPFQETELQNMLNESEQKLITFFNGLTSG